MRFSVIPTGANVIRTRELDAIGTRAVAVSTEVRINREDRSAGNEREDEKRSENASGFPSR